MAMKAMDVAQAHAQAQAQVQAHHAVFPGMEHGPPFPGPGHHDAPLYLPHHAHAALAHAHAMAQAQGQAHAHAQAHVHGHLAHAHHLQHNQGQLPVGVPPNDDMMANCLNL
jgi:hypothetical protein